jgi:hypothetical protein
MQSEIKYADSQIKILHSIRLVYIYLDIFQPSNMQFNRQGPRYDHRAIRVNAQNSNQRLRRFDRPTMTFAKLSTFPCVTERSVDSRFSVTFPFYKTIYNVDY